MRHRQPVIRRAEAQASSGHRQPVITSGGAQATTHQKSSDTSKQRAQATSHHISAGTGNQSSVCCLEEEVERLRAMWPNEGVLDIGYPKGFRAQLKVQVEPLVGNGSLEKVHRHPVITSGGAQATSHQKSSWTNKQQGQASRHQSGHRQQVISKLKHKQATNTGNQSAQQCAFKKQPVIGRGQAQASSGHRQAAGYQSLEELRDKQAASTGKQRAQASSGTERETDRQTDRQTTDR